MRIINLIEVINGNISQIISHVIHEDEDQADNLIIQEAEDTFKKTLIEVKGFDEETCESIVEDGYYNDDNGWELYLTWSSEVI